MNEPTTRAPCDPEDLRERARRGDPTLLADLFACYREDVLTFLRRRCGNTTDAEDAAQDTFLNAAIWLPGFRAEAGLRSWLYRLAGSACTKMRRGAKGDTRRHVPLDEGGEAAEDKGFAVAGLTDRLATVESRLEARLQPLEQALLELGDTDRAVLLLRDGEGFSTREVATSLELSEPAVRARLHRARKAVRLALGEDPRSS